MKLKDELLIAAEHIFIQKGFEAATIEEICLLAKHSRPTFYKRFKDKNELFAEYVASKSKMMVEVLEGLACEISDKKTFITQTKKYLTYMYGEDVLTFHCLVAGASRHSSATRRVFKNNLVSKHSQLRQRVVTQLIINGLIKPTRDIAKLAKLLGSLITADSYYLTVAGGQEPLRGKELDSYIEERCEIFLKIANNYL
jgi:AcrR family transcriptional regulator